MRALQLHCADASEIPDRGGGGQQARTAYSARGVITMPTRHGGAAATNHVSHGDDTATPAWAARSMHSRFCAAAVRNRLEEKLDTCTQPLGAPAIPQYIAQHTA